MKQNILIIKLGSFGDIIQINGCLKDIRNKHDKSKIIFLTTPPYKKLMSKCPFVDEILLDERKPRWNFIYLYKLKRELKKFNFIKVYDLQNSSRSEFYRKNLIKIRDWSSSRSILLKNETKNNFDKKSILDRFSIQLSRSGIQTQFTNSPQVEWMIDNNFDTQLDNRPYIVIFPFCSKKHPQKRWPYYGELIEIILSHSKEIEFVIAPGPGEIKDSYSYKAKVITDHNKPTNFFQLAKILKDSAFVISNDTGPAHLAAHLGCKGLGIFGPHTSPEKVSINTQNFLSITSSDLNELSANEVFEKIHAHLRFDDINSD